MVQKDQLLDFQDISSALDNSCQLENIGDAYRMPESNYTQTGIRLRRYNSKTGDFTSALNSSEEETDDECQHEALLR